jgi:hypothetical protein
MPNLLRCNIEVFQRRIQGACVERLKWLKHVRHHFLALGRQIERGGPGPWNPGPDGRWPTLSG